jgi:hypothetical protein
MIYVMVFEFERCRRKIIIKQHTKQAYYDGIIFLLSIHVLPLKSKVSRVRHKVSHPYKTKIMGLHTFILCFQIQEGKTKDIDLNTSNMPTIKHPAYNEELNDCTQNNVV